MSLENDFRRGYEDGFEGRPRANPSARDGALNSFLDGFFGRVSEDESTEAYGLGYREGCRVRSRTVQPAHA